MGEAITALIADANVLVAAAVAFAAGIVSFASPCVVPLVPGYLSYVTGLSGQDLVAEGPARTGRVLLGSSLFVLGFAVPFTLLGVAVTELAFLLTSSGAKVAMGAAVAGLGILMATGRLGREFRVTHTAPATGLAAAPVLGFVFGVGWTPCIGPALAAILTLGASVSAGASARGGFLAFVYALGLGLPFVVIGLGFRRAAGALNFLKRNARRLQLVGGGFLVLVGVALATGLWDLFIRWLRPFIFAFEPPI